MRPTDRTFRETTADALQGLGKRKLEHDGSGKPSAWETPGYLACEQLGSDHHVTGRREPGSAAPVWHFGEQHQAANPNLHFSPDAVPPRTFCPPTHFFFFSFPSSFLQ